MIIIHLKEIKLCTRYLIKGISTSVDSLVRYSVFFLNRIKKGLGNTDLRKRKLMAIHKVLQ